VHPVGETTTVNECDKYTSECEVSDDSYTSHTPPMTVKIENELEALGQTNTEAGQRVGVIE